MPMVICDGVPEYPVEPPYSALVVTNRVAFLQGSYKRVLEDVLCYLLIFHPKLEKAEESLVILHKDADGFRRWGSRIHCGHGLKVYGM